MSHGFVNISQAAIKHGSWNMSEKHKYRAHASRDSVSKIAGKAAGRKRRRTGGTGE